MGRRFARVLLMTLALAIGSAGCGGGALEPTAVSLPTAAPTQAALPTPVEPTAPPPTEPPPTAEPTAPPTEVQPTAVPEDPTEPNDEEGQATPLDVGSVQGALAEGDVDWYAITVPDGSVVDLAFTPNEGASDLAVAFVGPEGDVIWDQYDVEAGATSVRWVVSGESGGTHYLEVSDGLGPYRIDLEVTSQDDAGSRGDAGPEFRSALDVQPGAEVTGLLGDTDRADWYAFEIALGSTVTLTLTPEEGAEEMGIQLRDYEDSRLWDAGDVTARRPAEVTRVVPAEEVGIYAVGISGSAAYTLGLTVDPQDDGGSGEDAAADVAGAVEVAAGAPFTGLVGDTDRSDWFTFDVAAGSVLTVSVTPDEGTADLEVALRDPEDSLIDQGDIARGRSYEATVVIGPEAGGFWAIEVRSGSGGYTGQVDVEIQDDAGSGADAGDDVLGALEIAVGDAVQGIIGDTDTDDWYTFELASGQTVVITLEGGPGAEYLAVSLRDAEDSLIDSLQSVRERDVESIALEEGSPAGTYYLDVGSGGSGYSEYTLTIEEG